MDDEGKVEVEESEVKDVHLSKRATMYVSMAFIVIIICIVLGLQSCSITKKTNSNKPRIVTTPSPEVTEVVTNTGEKSTNSPEISPVLETSVPAGTETNLSQSKDNLNQSSYFEEVQEPSLGDEIHTTGLVTIKSVYKINDSYIYCVSIHIVAGNATVPVIYSCPKKTFDALNTGDSLNVTYQLDMAGNFSVLSISKP